jgi:hypothetical protein
VAAWKVILIVVVIALAPGAIYAIAHIAGRGWFAARLRYHRQVLDTVATEEKETRDGQ